MATSTSVRQYTVVSESRSETFSYQLRQNITFRDCRHGPRTSPDTQELHVERTFAMYVKEERILRYAITNKIGPLGGRLCAWECGSTVEQARGEGQVWNGNEACIFWEGEYGLCLAVAHDI